MLLMRIEYIFIRFSCFTSLKSFEKRMSFNLLKISVFSKVKEKSFFEMIFFLDVLVICPILNK
jgi:hypothetical protein